MSNFFNFKLISKDKNARLGKLSTAHGEINTPIFMPVGTAATIKAMHLKDVEAAGAEIIFPEALHDEKDFEKVRKELSSYLLANMTEFGKTKLLNYKQL